MLKDGDFQHIELMMGTNQDEGKLAVFIRALNNGVVILLISFCHIIASHVVKATM